MTLLADLVLLLSTLRHIRTTTNTVDANKPMADRDFSTLTVAVPARNETEDLVQCLQSLVNSDYPKLEILVLDDCSQEKRTPEIIKQFAHDGVRFIAGKTPPKRWLAKNYAYYQLAQEANGELLLFCGVDVRFEKSALRNLVTTMLGKEKSMLSMIPINNRVKPLLLESLLLQGMRYGWELTLPRKLFDRPPVLSACWIIRHDSYAAYGGFAAVRNTITPERYFAKKTADTNDGYSFMQCSSNVGQRVYSKKLLTSQQATAIRTRYPQLHRRVENTMSVIAMECVIFLLPYGLLLNALIKEQWIATVFYGIIVIINHLIFYKIIKVIYRQRLLASLILLPFSVVYDIGILLYSMWRYEFSEIDWRGRNVCIPVMQIYTSLPHIR